MSTDPDDRTLEVAAGLFGMLAAPTRLRIMCTLIDGERSVSELPEQFAVRQPSMSQHLATLCRARVSARRRAGAHILYCIENEQVQGPCLALDSPHRRSTTRMATASSSR